MNPSVVLGSGSGRFLYLERELLEAAGELVTESVRRKKKDRHLATGL